MKKYMKPAISVKEIEAMTIMAGSDIGTSETPVDPSGSVSKEDGIDWDSFVSE